MAGPSPSDGPPDRHGRQSLLPGVGPGGQERLRGSHAAVVGAGALGCVSLDWLCRAGVGRLTVIDRDVIEPTNLQRQVLYDARHLERGLPKAVAAAERLREIDPGVRVEGHVADVTHANIASLLEGAEVVLDGTDNFETRFLINDHAVRSGTPFVYAGAVGTRAMAAAFASGERSPCLRCVFRDPPPAGSQPTCDTAGVLGPAVGLAASWQAAQAVAILIGREVRTRLV
ncbi:MAG: ThiF family adenylyltransferase, partial [Planctomycetota bacterium]